MNVPSVGATHEKVSRSTKLTAVALLLVAALLAFALRPREVAPRPNVLLIVTDDQHPAAIRTMPVVLADLAGRGVSFENAFASTPICAPSRASILTGQYPVSHGVRVNGKRLPDGTIGSGALDFEDSSTLATWLQGAGYKTALIGKYLNQYPLMTPYEPPGWNEWRVFAEDIDLFFDYDLNENGTHVHYGNRDEDYSTDVLARHAIDFIQRHANDRWFLMLAPAAPHDPSEPAPRHRGALEDLPPWRPPSWNEDTVKGKPSWLAAVTRNVTEEGLSARTRKRTHQLESLLAVDDAIKALLDTLDELGIADDTMIILTADHGLSWGEHRWFGKQMPYEESIRVPLVIRYPARWPEARRLEQLVLNVDIAPTIAELAGATPTLPVEGHSLVGPIDGSESVWRSAVLLRHFKHGFLVPPWSSVRTARYKYIRVGKMEELYDLEKDPYELHNLAGEADLASLRADLARQMDEMLEQRDRGVRIED